MAFIRRESQSELNVTHNQERLKLPPISAMDSLIATRSWAPQTETSYIPLLTPPQRDQWKFSPPISHETKHYNDYYTAGYSQSLPSRLSSSHLTTSPFETLSNNEYKPYQQNSNPYNISTYHAEQDVEEVVLHCNNLCENMVQKKKILLESQSISYLFDDSNSSEPWLEDMIGKANQVLNALLRLRKHQLAAQRQQEENTMLESNNRWPHGSSINDTRQRRRGKKSNFQGRCHTCNISETPEWRRGPDGARTLCNACGLHYAKLVRKKGQKGTETMEIESYPSRKLTPPADDGLTG
ncbi:hypothetical protein K501DRAFT_331935 [Backusella circina FSU 941]|nr:hypothetical protein K501DRAFT_331935 [Backusella circina FSU 941]